MRKRYRQRGHLIYPVVEKHQPEIQLDCFNTENRINFLCERQKYWTLGGIEAIMHTLYLKKIQLLKKKGYYDYAEDSHI